MAAYPHVVAGYLEARRLVLEAGYGSDIDWAEGLALVKPGPGYVLQETAWVILNSGFRFTVARKLWPNITRGFRGWVPEDIDESCIEEALKVLRHKGKIEAMAEMARIVRTEGVSQILADAQDPPKLRRLPWIGSITCWHLAKVLGVDVVKPDIHLTRAAIAAGFPTPQALCEAVREALGDRLTVIDSVFWRYGEQMKLQGWSSWTVLFGT
jgi:hypothetical protein